jgi:hypothetical protein
MRVNSLRRIAGLAFAIGLLLPAAAGAQVALHELSVKGKVLFQDFNNKDEPRVGSQSFNERDIIGICLDEEKPAKTLKLFVRLDCEGLLEGGSIEIWNTGDPIQMVDEIGEVSLGTFPLVKGTSFEEPKEITALGEVDIACGLGAFDTEIFGRLRIKFSEDDQGNFCPSTGNGSKLVGEMEVFGDDGIVDNGRVKLKKPSINVQPQ